MAAEETACINSCRYTAFTCLAHREAYAPFFFAKAAYTLAFNSFASQPASSSCIFSSHTMARGLRIVLVDSFRHQRRLATNDLCSRLPPHQAGRIVHNKTATPTMRNDAAALP